MTTALNAAPAGAVPARSSAEIFPAAAVEVFRSHFPDAPCTFRHGLVGHPLLRIDALRRLAPTLPANCQEYHSGAIDPSQPDAARIPGTGLSYTATIAEIDTAKAWMSLRSVQHDPAYRALLDEAIAALGPASLLPGGRTYMHDGFAFVSSPGTTTPFHFDPEHNVLMQIEGEKTVYVYPAGDKDILKPEDHEELHATGKTNIRYDAERFASKAKRFDLKPGDALYMPVKAPHWVQNGTATSISFSITWRSAATDFDRRVHMVNRRLRALGLTPTPVGLSPVRDRLKAAVARFLERLS